MSLKVKRILYVALPLTAVAALLITRPFWIWLAQHMPPCMFYHVTDLYCPGCGNSRSVRALLDGQLWLSLRYNITPLLTLVIGGLWYAEWGFSLFGRPRKLLPRRAAVIVPLSVLLLLYFVVRNIWEFMPV